MVVPSVLRASRRLLQVCAIVALLSRRSEAAPPARKPVTLGIAFHVVDVEGRAVVDDAFIDQRVARANEIFAPYGLDFVRAETTALPASHAVVQDLASRTALAAEVSDRAQGVIDCFVVREYRDLDDPAMLRGGVHWRAVRPRRHFIILGTTGADDVLAHELGHYLGNPRHAQVAGNLMSYQRGDTPVLDAAQRRNLALTLRASLGRGDLRPRPEIPES